MSGIRQFSDWLDKQFDDVGANICRQMLKEFRATVPRNRPARRATSRAITPETVEAIRRLDARGLSQHAIAEQLHVNQGRVNEVLKGRR